VRVQVAIANKICLPQRKYTRSASQPITLVLDLDETLVSRTHTHSHTRKGNHATCPAAFLKGTID
jgi:predicted secreted Zn-dependent protease